MYPDKILKYLKKIIVYFILYSSDCYMEIFFMKHVCSSGRLEDSNFTQGRNAELKACFTFVHLITESVKKDAYFLTFCIFEMLQSHWLQELGILEGPHKIIVGVFYNFFTGPVVQVRLAQQPKRKSLYSSHSSFCLKYKIVPY